MKRLSAWWAVMCLAGLVHLAGGCGGDARVELAASDGLAAIADQMEQVVREYHAEVSAGDDAREAAVAGAFAARVAGAAGDEQAVADHTAQFLAALHKIRVDRETEWDRRNNALANTATLRELGKGLRKLAVQSLTLNDEVKRYLTSWMDAYQRSQQEAAASRQQQQAAKQEQRQALISQGVGVLKQETGIDLGPLVPQE